MINVYGYVCREEGNGLEIHEGTHQLYNLAEPNSDE